MRSKERKASLTHCIIWVTVRKNGCTRVAGLDMRFNQLVLGSGRRAAATAMVAAALISSGLMVGLVNPAAAAGPATQLAVTTQPSSAAVSGTVLAQQPVVQIEDSSGNVVTTDTSTVTAAFTSGGVNVSNASVAAVNGVATFTNLALTADDGSYTLTFTDSSLTAAVSNAVVVSGPATKLVITTQPSTSEPSGVALVVQPVVKVEDANNNVVLSNTSTVTAAITAPPVGSSVANATAVAVAGVATFSGLDLTGSAGTYTLTFTDGGLTAAVSSTITVSAGGASKLVIVTEPSSAAPSGAALAQQPVLKIEDAGGNIVTTNTSTVTANITSSSYTALHNTAVAVAGVATFSALALNAPSGAYTLTFSDGGLTAAASSTITVSAGVATQLVITTQPSSSAPSGAVLAQKPVVKVEDAAGNVIASDTSTATARITTGGVSVTNASATAVAGVATFSGLALNALAGSYTLTFTDGSLTAAVSNSIAVSVGAATQLKVTSEPSLFVSSGAVLAAQPVVKVEDSGGNVEAGLSTGDAAASIYTGVSGAISAGATTPFVAGVATFSGLALTGVVGDQYSLLFSGDGFSVIDSAKIVVGTQQSPLSVTSVKGTYGRTLRLRTSGGSGTGAVTFAVVKGTANGCKVSGSTLSYASTGTCIVTATKASDVTYASASSPATTVTITKLPKPAPVKITFTSTRSTLSTAAKNALINLSKKLTTKSSVTITGYARSNLGLAKSRATAVSRYLVGRIKVKVTFKWVTRTTLREVVVATTAQ